MLEAALVNYVVPGSLPPTTHSHDSPFMRFRALRWHFLCLCIFWVPTRPPLPYRYTFEGSGYETEHVWGTCMYYSYLLRFGVTWSWHECDKLPSLRQEIISRSYPTSFLKCARQLCKRVMVTLETLTRLLREGVIRINYFHPEMQNRVILFRCHTGIWKHCDGQTKSTQLTPPLIMLWALFLSHVLDTGYILRQEYR
jgi:hypothetical protein